MEDITLFEGEYVFMRNDYESVAQVVFDGDVYSCVQRAFQAAKTNDPAVRKRIREAKSIRDVNNIGRREIDLSPDWDMRKIGVMEDLIRKKFQGSIELADKLLATGDANIEMSHSYDTFWGTDANGEGRNEQGKILMKIREELKILYPEKAKVNLDDGLFSLK